MCRENIVNYRVSVLESPVYKRIDSARARLYQERQDRAHLDQIFLYIKNRKFYVQRERERNIYIRILFNLYIRSPCGSYHFIETYQFSHRETEIFIVTEISIAKVALRVKESLDLELNTPLL